MKTIITALAMILTAYAVAADKPPAEVIFKSVPAMLATMPAKLRSIPAEKWNAIQREEVNDALKEHVSGHEGKLVVTVYSVAINEKAKDDADKYILLAQAGKVGQTPLEEIFLFDADQKDKVADMKQGEKVTISGTINPVEYTTTEGVGAFDVHVEVLVLQLQEHHCKVTK